MRIQTPGLEQRIGFPSPILTQNAAGRSHHVTPGEEAWVVEWWAVEEGEAVPPGGPDHPLSVLCEASVPRDGKVVGIYTIVAEGMKPKEGTIEVYATGDISISPEG